ncbi:hypothetical protein GN958_ATG21336 [Phytophthora infestans]|uniref:FAR1 domain-containing protein n=1 Tax=Phytophthora infestans TaxID=4787 RepID=A0A8S9TRB7_PHYIN|nr:hypothetical protein GN958_ATG21336 [Phytophthora infestans]
MASDVESEATAEKSDSAASVSTRFGDDNSPDVSSQESVRAPELDVKLFASWGEMESYLSSYSRRTYQLYSVRTATPFKTRNDRIKKNQTSCKTIPEELELYNKTFVCTHHGSPRRSRSAGKRPKQHSRKIGCPAQVGFVLFHADSEDCNSETVLE